MGIPSLKNCSVLVIEDEPIILLDTMDVLRSAGARVQGVSTARDALRLMKFQKFAAAVVDWRLGGDTACSLIAHLIDENVPIVIYSAWDCSELLSSEVQVLQKPVAPATLVAAIRTAVKSDTSSSHQHQTLALT